MKRLLAALVVVGAFVVQVSVAEAKADVLCEHRSAAHEAEHGGHEADNAWHIAHGDLPTCDDGSSHSEQRHDDDKSRYCRRHFFC